MYKIACNPEMETENVCTIEFDDDTVIELSPQRWNQIIQKGLAACGYLDGQRIRSVTAKPCEGTE